MATSKQGTKPLLSPLVKTQGWAHFFSWQIDRSSKTPLFRQIYQEIRTAILSQTLRRGTKLPSTRPLASQLGVSRTSVISAYEQLLDEGYISGQVGSGSYICFDPPTPSIPAAAHRKREAVTPSRSAKASETLNEFADSTAQWDERAFNTGRTLLDARSIEIWRKLTNRALRSLSSGHLGYSDPRGFRELRKIICDYLRAARGVRCEPDQIIITSGTQQAINIAIRVLLHPGEEVWVEDPGYPLIRYALIAARVKICPVSVDS